MDIGIFLQNQCIYFAPNGVDGFGNTKFLPPVQLDCRWEDKQQELIAPDGRTVISKSHIMAGQKMQYGGVLWLGTLDDWKATTYWPGVPTKIQGGSEILIYAHTPDIDGTDLLHEAWC